MIEKIKKYIIEKQKFLIFLLIFTFVCLLYSSNIQSINYNLKRGTILEYSSNQEFDIDEDEFSEFLNSQNIRYHNCNYFKTDKNDNILDFENKKVNNVLYITVSILADEKQAEKFDSISDYIFGLYPDAKLLDIKALNNTYSKPYRAFLNFILIAFISFALWILFLYFIYGEKELYKIFKEDATNYFQKQKTNFLNFCKSTKEKGILYFLKRILFDDVTDENEKDIKFSNELIKTIVFVIICVIVIRYFIGELRWIPSGSMRPTILEKDRVFVEKLDFPTKKEAKRGDILVFYPPEVELSNSPIAIFSRLSGIFCKDIAYIKRLIALPGEKFEIKQNQNDEYQVYINDEPLNEPYIISKTNWSECRENMYCGPFVVPDGYYFMMGDNRGNSQDSRFWGFLDKNRVIGRANFMFFPTKRINFLKDKYLNLKKSKTEKRTYVLNRYEFLYKI